MFSSLTQRLGTRAIDRLDVLVELSTLGGYGLDREGVFALEEDDLHEAHGPHRLDGHDSPAPLPRPRSRDDCPYEGRVSAPCRDAPARP